MTIVESISKIKEKVTLLILVIFKDHKKNILFVEYWLLMIPYG
jgi:hypothetical protein